jgi:methionine-rich copper-binding protein CopC
VRWRPPRGWAVRLLLAALLAAVPVLWMAPPAAAHAYLVSSSPADGATVGPVPNAVSLTFDEAVHRSFAAVVVTGPDGRRWDTGSPTVVGATVRQDLAPLPAAGRYAIAYRVVSADGHPVGQQLHFTFAPPAGYTPAVRHARVNQSGQSSRRAGAATPSWPAQHARDLLIVVAAVVAGALLLLVDHRRRASGPA